MFSIKQSYSLRAVAAVLLLLCASTMVLAQEVKKIDPTANPIVVMETNVGKIEIEMWPHVAPVTVENFLDYVRDGFYDNTIFHRVVRGGIYVIQGGGFDRDLKKKSTQPPIKLEAVESNRKYTLSMARQSHPDSATCQFFINTRDNTALDPGRAAGGYAVFAKVIKGAGVVDQIGRTPITNKGGAFKSLPAQQIYIKRAYVKE